MFPSPKTLQSKPRSRPLGALECVAALALALALAALVDAFTGIMPPKWDPESYMDMARNGVWGNDRLRAPFAYRPAMPWLARQASDLFSLPLSGGFLWVSRAFAALFLFTTYLLARRFTDKGRTAVVAVLFAATFVMPLKFSLFVPASVDVAAYPVMMLAVWAWLGGRLGLCLAVSAAGLFFKEFLAIPLLLCLAEYGLRWRAARAERNPRAARRLWAFAGAFLLAAAVVLIPRLALPVVDTYQEIDPLNDIHSLSRLVMNPLSPRRDFNILFCIASFWLPFLLLWTRARGREVLGAPVPLKLYFAGFLILNAVLVMYGGTNIYTFVSYSAPVQIAALALLLSQRRDPVRPYEWIVALACVTLYNRVFFTLPLPDDGFDAYIDFYGGWSARVNASTLLRCLEMAGYLVLMQGARRILRRFAHAGPASGT